MRSMKMKALFLQNSGNHGKVKTKKKMKRAADGVPIKEGGKQSSGNGNEKKSNVKEIAEFFRKALAIKKEIAYIYLYIQVAF